jgi:hypothetical protein
MAYMDWEAIYREMLPKVYHYFCYQVGDERIAEDLTSTSGYQKDSVSRSKSEFSYLLMKLILAMLRISMCTGWMSVDQT